MPSKLEEEFIEMARSYTDTRLMNTIKQSYNFSKEKVEAAKAVAIERNLLSPDSIDKLGGQEELMRNAKSMLEGGGSVDDIMKNLMSRGSTEEEATLAVHEASKVADMNRQPVVEDEKTSYWMWGFAAFVILRIILRAFRDN